METYVALLRAINVGGRNSLPMRLLVSCLEAAGSQNVKTYIQSGNVVFQHRERDSRRLRSKIVGDLHKRCGFEPNVLLLSPELIGQAIKNNPFPEGEAEPACLHVGFLAASPLHPDLKALQRVKSSSEKFLLRGTLFYLYAPEGVGRSRLAAIAERALGEPMTDRNWRTVCKLQEMIEALN